MKTVLASFAFFLLLTSVPLLAQEGAKDILGKPIPFWLERLQSKDLLERDEAIAVFSRSGAAGKEAVPLLKPMLKDGSATTRLQVALALWKIQDDGKDSVATLTADFATLTPAQRQGLLGYLLSLKKSDDSLFAMFALFLKDPTTTNQVVFHLPKLGSAAIPQYAKWIEASKGKERALVIGSTPAVYLLGSKGEIVGKYLKDEDPLVQVAAGSVLLNVPEKRDDALAVLIEQANAKDQEVSDLVLWTLANHRPVFKKAAAIYLAGLKHPRLDYRLAVVVPVLLLEPEKAEQVVPILEEALLEKSINTRYLAYQLIPQLGAKAEKLAPVLLEKLRDPKNQEMSLALSALAPQAERVSKELGEILFADPATAQRQVGPLHRPFAPHLIESIHKHLTGDDAARQRLALSLARRVPGAKGEKLVPGIVPLLKKDGLTALSLDVLEAYGKVAASAAPEIFAVAEGTKDGRTVAQVQRVLLRLQPELAVVGPMLDKLKAKATLTKEERILAAELALLIPARRKEAAELLEPMFDPKSPIDLFAMKDTLEKLGPDGAKLVPLFRPLVQRGVFSSDAVERVFIRMGPAAKELVPDILEQAKSNTNYSSLLRAALVVYALDPEKRGPLDERITQLFLERLERLPQGSELGYHYSQLGHLCRMPPGPTKALAPLLSKVIRSQNNDELRADLVAALVKLEPTVEAEMVKLFEGRLGEYPNHSRGAIVGLLRLKPDHPQALAAAKKYLESSQYGFPSAGATIAAQVERPLPGVRELLEAQLKTNQDLHFRLLAYLTLMRYDGKLNPAWIDEILSKMEAANIDLRLLTTLGAVGKPLIPRLRAVSANESVLYRLSEVIFWLERAE